MDGLSDRKDALMKIEFGIGSDSIPDQLRKQGAFCPIGEVNAFQEDVNQISRLYYRGYLTTAQCKSARDKVAKSIFKAVAKYAAND